MTWCGHRTRGERGQAAVQYAAVLPITLIAILLCYKVYVTVSTVERVNNAALTGARAASKTHNLATCSSAAKDTLPSWLTEPINADDHFDDGSGNRVRVTAGGNPIYVVSCRVQAKIPMLTSSIPLDFTVDRTVQMPG